MRGVLTILYLFLPAFVANATPVLACHVPLLRKWNAPLHARLLGSHKTYRGLVTGVLCGVLVSLLQYALRGTDVLGEITLVHSTVGQSVLVGLLLALGALVGDAVESAVKRQMHLAPGKALPYWDGVDYMIGSILFLSPVYLVPLPGVLLLLVIGPLLSLCANCVSYLLGLKEVWY